MTNNHAKRASGAMLLAAALGLALPAISLAGQDTTQKVLVGDLDLTKAKDQHKLERRTEAAINQVCPMAGSAYAGPRATSPAATRKAHRDCAQAARASVQQQLGHRSQAVARAGK